ncbi:MAG TPA: hypothetical protein VFG04_20820 [Planctomycetaceae bacterium]|jgi:hypothetical protein|nr:hypothetical protein [Planctomycetaceae bacterium]
MSRLFATLAIVGGFAALAAHQSGRLALPNWVSVVPIVQTTVDKDAADYGEQFKQIHVQAEKDLLAHKYNGPTAAKDLHEWLSSACDAARKKSFAGVSKPLADAMTGPDGKPAPFNEQTVAAACHKIATQ